eukprot:g8850.t1
MWGAVNVFCTWILLYSPALSFSFAGPLALRNTKEALQKKTRIVPILRAASDAETGPASSPAVDGDDPPSATDLVTELLGKIEGTNRGIDCTCSERDSIDGIIEQLGTLGADKDWLNDPNIYGNYNVAYVSSGASQRGNPAGGRWRGRVGRCLFRTEEMFQHLLEPATAVNMIVFRAFGIFRGCVTLRGEFEEISDQPNFVKASFGPPLLNLLGKRGVTIQSGPKSSVRLAATFVDDRVRLGKGGRGSLFVFTRGGPAETSLADEWRLYTADSARPVKARALGAAAACGALAAGVRSAFLPAGVLAVLSVLLVGTQLGRERAKHTA